MNITNMIGFTKESITFLKNTLNEVMGEEKADVLMRVMGGFRKKMRRYAEIEREEKKNSLPMVKTESCLEYTICNVLFDDYLEMNSKTKEKLGLTLYETADSLNQLEVFYANFLSEIETAQEWADSDEELKEIEEKVGIYKDRDRIIINDKTSQDITSCVINKEVCRSMTEWEKIELKKGETDVTGLEKSSDTEIEINEKNIKRFIFEMLFLHAGYNEYAY